MPNIGGVYVPDDLMPRMEAPAAERPGLGAILGAAAEGAWGQLRYGAPYAALKVTGTSAPEDDSYYQQGLAEASRAAAAAAPASVSDLTSGRVGFGRFVAENLAGSLPYMGAAAVGGLAGGLAGGPGGALAGAVAAGTPQFVGTNVGRAVEEEGTLTPEAAVRSVAVAPFQSAADAAIGMFLPGVGKVGGKLATKSFLTRTVASIAEAAGTEAVTEAAQQLGERYAAGKPLSDSDAAGEYVNAAVTAMAVGGVLGAGGGFRRTPAVEKAASEVTTDDISQHIDQVLALPAPGQAGLPALPSPEMFGRSSTEPVAEQLTPIVQNARPTQLPTDFIVDSQGRVAPDTAEGERAIAIDRNSPIAAPSQADFNAQIAQILAPRAPNVLAQQPEAPRAATSVAALTQTPVGEVGTVTPAPASRLFRDVPLDDLTTAIGAKTAPADVKERAQAEIAARWQEAAGAEPLTTDKFQTRLDDVKSGLRGGWVQKLEAETPAELLDKVHTRIFDDADTSANVAKLAQRLGLLDENLEPTERANEITAAKTAAIQAEVGAGGLQAQPLGGLGGVAEPAPASPVTREKAIAGTDITAPPPVSSVAPPPVQLTPSQPDPAFAAQWDQLKKDAGISRLRSGKDALGGTPPDLATAQRQVMGALANVDAFEAPETDQVEAMARKMGLVTDDDMMDVTPLGRQVFLSTPAGTEATVQAARLQGYDGAKASLFDRGARGEAAPSFADFEEMAAFQAGKVWAQDYVQNGEVATAAQTRRAMGNQDTRATGQAVAREQVRSRELTPAQVQQQGLNQLLDAADLSGVRDSDVATLRRLVRQGVSPQALGTALQQVQGGQTLFRQPATTPSAYAGERPVRGQPKFKEMAGEVLPVEPSKAEQRVQSEEAVQAYDLRNLIELARSEGGIVDARAQKLHDLLDQGKVAQVKRLLKDFDPDAKPRAPRLPTPPETVFERAPSGLVTGAADAQFEAAIAGKDVAGVLDHMIKAAPSKFQREIMRKVKSLTAQMAKAGVKMDIQVVRPGDTVPAALNSPNIRALTVSKRNPSETTIYLKSSEMGGESGTNYQLAAHELLHATTDMLVDWGSRPGRSEGSQLRKDVKDLIDLGNAIISHFNTRAAEGNLNEFEKSYYARANNALQNAHEIIAWGLTNPDMQRYLQSIEYAPRQSVFSKLVDLLRKLLGLDGKYDTALTELLRVSERIMKPGQLELASSWAMNNVSGFDTTTLESSALEGAPAGPTAASANDVTQSAAQKIADAYAKLAPAATTAKDKVRETLLGYRSRNDINEWYGSLIPGILANTRAHEARVAVRNQFQLVGENVVQMIEKLRQAKNKDADRINELMRVAQFGIDGAKTWDEHVELHDDPNAANLKALHADARDAYGTLVRHNTVGIFEEARAANEAQNYGHMLGQLFERIASDPEHRNSIPGGTVSPGDALVEAKGLGTATQMRDHLKADLDRRLAIVDAWMDQRGKEVAGWAKNEQADALSRLSPLQGLVAEIKKNQALMAQKPYFHLPRFGDHYAAFEVANKDGVVDKAALVKVAQALEDAGFDDVQLSTDNSNPRVMIRTDSRSKSEMLVALGQKLAQQKLVDPESVQGGPRSREDNYGLGGRVPDYLASALERIDTDPMFQPDPSMSADEKAALEAHKNAFKQTLVDGWIDMQPDNSLAKVLAKRRNVQGASVDMIRGFAHRQNLGAVGVAAVLTRPKFAEALQSMRATVEESHQADNELDPYMVGAVVKEVRRRELETPVNEMADSFDKLRAIAHSYYLGFNPSSSVINASALGTTVLPELAKKHGYSKSFHAMRRASVQALSILKASFLDAQQRGAAHRADLSLTESVLDRANIPTEVRDFVRRRIADGDIDLGTMSRALGQVSSGKGDTTLDRALRYGAAFNMYSEAFARLTAAIAARDLHGAGNSQSAHDYARQVVKNSLFEFQPGNTARQLGRNGILGPVTPLVTQFMQWNLQVTEKLVREMKTAFVDRAATPELKAEARRFLAGHMVAMTALAGTLGLPFATVFASAIEGLMGDDDDPFDATSAYRNFLSDMLGKDVAEVVARGLPRAIGLDVSQRAGEQNILPFSEFMADRRSWKDAIADTVGRGVGAAPNMLISVLDGGNMIAEGDVLGGMKQLLPVALKNPTEAYRLTADGYVDTKGNKLPVTPGGSAILWQLLGFTPSAKAEYGEVRMDQASRRGELSRRAGELRQGIKRAFTSGDQDQLRDLVTQATEFDAANPAFAVVPSIVSSIEREQQAQAVARTARVPIGVSMRDVAGQQMTGYANF